MIRILSLVAVAASLTLASCASAPKKDSCCATKPAATKAAGAKCESCEKDKGHKH